MLQHRIYQNRADRVIALGRAALAGFAAIAINIDPPSVTTFHSDLVIEVYFLASLAFALALTSRSTTAPPLGTYAMASDIVVFSALVYISANQSSPFFPMLLFIILSATLKWQWRGAAAVGGIVFLLFLPSGLALDFFGPAPDNQTMRFVMRAGNLLVMSALLVFFGRQREGVWAELLRLSAPISNRAGPGGLPVAACLSHAADFFRARRALLIWRADDGQMAGADWRDGTVASLTVDPAVHFVDGAAPTVIQFREAGARSFVEGGSVQAAETDMLLPPAVRAAWGLDAGVAASLHGEQLSGWLIVPGAIRDEDLYLARAVAAQVAVALDRAGADRAWREAAAGEERVRLARDLHDGILQFLTGLALQLRIIERDGAANPAMKERIGLLQSTLVAEQTELRQFVQGMSVAGGGDDPVAELRRLARLLAHHWDIEIAVAFEDGFDSCELASDVRQIVREAVANAVRHGGATRVEIRGRVDADGIGLDIADNGAGLARRGRFDIGRMAREAIGPKSLRTRVAGLGGALTADSRADGLTLAIDLPMRWREAAE